jgi:ribose transport system substrate-binding protein
MKPLPLLGVLAITVLSGCGRVGDSSAAGGEKYGKFTLLATKYDNVDQTKAKDNAADVLTQLQGVANVGLIGLWAYNPPAILAAVKAAKKEGKVAIVGFDEDEITLQGIKDGHIHATVVQQPFEFGYQSVRLMNALVKNPESNPDPKVVKDGVYHIPHLVVKKDNVEEFHRKLKEQKAGGEGPALDAPAGKAKVAFVSNNTAEFWTIAEAGTRKAAQDFGVEVLFRRPKSPTAAAQKEIIQDLLTQGVQAIAISVIDPDNQRDFLNEVADKVPLVTQDNDAPKTRRKLYLGTDNYEAGKAVGKLVKEVMPEGGTIAIFVGQPDPINAKQRRQGVLDELAGK